jgi:hypothetical protein
MHKVLTGFMFGVEFSNPNIGAFIEGIVWKELPGASHITLLGWQMRTMPGQEDAKRSFVLFRIQLLWLELEVFFQGGNNEQ